jgi:hypothetical protein
VAFNGREDSGCAFAGYARRGRYLAAKVFVLSQLSNGFRAARHARVQQLKQSETKRLMSEALASRIAGVLLTLYLECCSAPRRGLRRIENAAVGQLYCCWLKGRKGASPDRSVRVRITRGLAIMKIIIIVAAGLVAMLSVAAAADLPRKEPPPPAPAPIGKYPVGKYPVGKYPVGKYPQPVVTKG